MNGTEIREKLRVLLVEATNCGIQEGQDDGKGWPCGTCTCALLGDLGLDESTPDYNERDAPPDRINEVWRAILQIRSAQL